LYGAWREHTKAAAAATALQTEPVEDLTTFLFELTVLLA
jgi:hypothetical protein